MIKKYPNIPEDLLQLLNKFLAIQSESHGGWAPVGEDDVSNLDTIIYEIIKTKYEEDPDGDLPINFIITDRTKYEPFNYLNVEYAHKLKTVNDYLESVDIRISNALSEISRLDRVVRMFRDLARADDKVGNTIINKR